MFNATSEAGFLAGYGATFSAGGGFFHDPFDDASFGGFMSAGAFVGPPNDFGPVDSLTTSKSPKCNPPFVMGSAHGLSSGLWVSNAGSPKQLGGPFDQVNYNLIIASLSVAYSGDTWIAGLTFGPKTVLGPVSVGLSMSSYPTTTFSAGGVNLSGRPILYVPNE